MITELKLTNEELMELSPEFDKFEIENILREKDDLIKRAIKENKTPTQILKELQPQELEEFPKRSPLNVGGELQNPEKADLNKDGKITKADILMGRGVIGKKKKKKKKMKAFKSPMQKQVRKS